MISPRFPLALGTCILLTQCYYTPQPMGTGFQSYPPQQSAYQADVRAHDQTLQQRAYEEGIRSGQIDRMGRQAPDHRRYARQYSAATERAFADGYQRGYQQNQSPYQQPGNATGYPLPGAPSAPPPYPPAPSQPSATQSTQMYNQGYDYGMRDRAARRPRDPSAHTSSMDPWSRQSFEKGYIDAYNALPNRR